MALSGATAIVGAPGHNVDAHVDQGAAYIFMWDGAVWTQQVELIASDGRRGDDFGTAVALSGATAIVGAYRHQVGANASQGTAYIFVQEGGRWTQQAELTASDGQTDDELGLAVSVDGTTAIVGAAGHLLSASTLVRVPPTSSCRAAQPGRSKPSSRRAMVRRKTSSAALLR